MVVYLKDGSPEHLIGNTEEQFGNLIEQYLGKDCRDVYDGIIDDYTSLLKEISDSIEDILELDTKFQMLQGIKESINDQMKNINK